MSVPGTRRATKASLVDETILRAIYDCLAAHYGPTNWWPGDTPFEIAVGAVLTQNTAWGNVEKAIANLKKENLLKPEKILECSDPALEKALRPSGYFRVKAKRLRSFCRYLTDRYKGDMSRMKRRHLESLRPELLQVNGIGPETCDDILLYACEKPVFVIDAYTRRILGRHGLIDSNITYEALRELFERKLGPDVALFKEYHGLLVYAGKDFCRRSPACSMCPLRSVGQPPAVS